MHITDGMRETGRLHIAPMALIAAFALTLPARSGEVTVRVAPVDDLKAVVASVEPAHQLTARARIGGTVSALKIKEGDDVAGGAEIAMVVDQKLFLQMQALDQRIQSQEAQRDKAQADFGRAQELFRRGVYTKALFDQAKTAFDVAERSRLDKIRADVVAVGARAAGRDAARQPGVVPAQAEPMTHCRKHAVDAKAVKHEAVVQIPARNRAVGVVNLRQIAAHFDKPRREPGFRRELSLSV